MTSKSKLSSQQIIQLKQQGITQKSMSKIFGITPQTLVRWKKQKNPTPRERKRKPKDYGNIPELLASHIATNNTITQNELADLVSKETGQEITQKKVSYILRKRLNYTYKKLTFHYTQLDEEKAKAFNEEIKPLLVETPFLALDECSFYPNSDPRFGYAFKGLRAINKKPSNQGEHYTLLFAVSNSKVNGLVHWKLVKGSADWKIFYDFLEEIKSIGDKKNILLMDNARIHHAPKKRREANLPAVKEQMTKKNIEVRFITAYAPMLNPTELVFNLLRQQTEKQRPRNFEEMKLAIEKVVELLNTKDLRKYFWHCATYFDRKDAKNKLKKVNI